MATVKVNGIEIYYEIHGDAYRATPRERLLLIMGLGANATAWESQIPALSREYQVIAYDNRGAGRSEKPNEAYSIPQMADDAAGLMGELGIQQAHVFGMSMGGMIAQELVLRHPQSVSKLILGGTMTGGPKAVMAGPLLLQQMASAVTLPMEKAIEAGLPLLYSDEYLAANKERLLKRSLENAHLMAPPYALQRQAMAVMTFNAYDRLPEVNATTLVMTGTNDKIVPAANSRILTERIPQARLVEFEGAGHGFLVEKAAETNAAVLDFLRGPRSEAPAAK